MIRKSQFIEDVYIIESESHLDSRGSFVELFNRQDFPFHNINFVQTNLATNLMGGTLRGLHYQEIPFSENKLVSCVKGEIWDVIIDVRKDSSSYKRYIGINLSEFHHRSVLIPPGCAHGYITLSNHTKVLYQVDQFYSPEHSKGIRWNDRSFNIEWPMTPQHLSDKDLNWPNYDL